MNPLVSLGIAVTCVVIATWLAVRAIRWAKKGTSGGKAVAAALFLFPDQPPPHELVEQQIRLKRDTDSGDPPTPS